MKNKMLSMQTERREGITHHIKSTRWVGANSFPTRNLIRVRDFGHMFIKSRGRVNNENRDGGMYS